MIRSWVCIFLVNACALAGSLPTPALAMAPQADRQVAVLPDVSPRSLANLVANLRATWQKDAIPVMVSVNDEGGAVGFQTTYDMYSPSTRSGMMVVVGASGQTRLPAPHPNWSTIPLPQNFVSLAQVGTVVRAQAIDHAVLFWQTGNAADPHDFSWVVALKTPNAAPEVIPALLVSRDEVSWLESQAGHGDAKAQYALARIEEAGLAGSVDMANAMKWLNQSAALGNAQAQNNLGQHYQFGIGVAKNPSVAAQWYNKAAGAGNAVAKYNLALLYETGLGVQQNWNRALSLLSDAIKGGAPGALQEFAAIRPAADRVAHQARLAAQQRQGASGETRAFRNIIEITGNPGHER